MSRKPISREKLDEFIKMSAELSRDMRAPIQGTTSEIRTTLLKKIETICDFLKDAEKHRIVYTKAMPAYRFVRDGGADIHSTRRGDTFLPAKDSTRDPFSPWVVSPQKYFSDAARHVGVMARAINNEQKCNQISERVTRPYNGNVGDWQPAKLAA